MTRQKQNLTRGQRDQTRRASGAKSTGEMPVTMPIAIIGMSAIFPQAANLEAYWQNILRKVDAIVEVPPSRWNKDDYYDPDPRTPDKVYCKRGGFIPDVAFDPAEFGLPPNILEATDVSQLLSLVVARDALADAGYGEGHDFPRQRTGVILGFVGVSTKLFVPLITRLQYPVWEKVLRNCGIAEPDIQKIIEKIKLAYVGWEENSFPGTIGNVVAGRIANRFDLGGTNFVVDAACASSMAAIKMAISELVEGRADMMLTGGLDTDNSISSYICFSKTPAFTREEHVRPFDADSSGMMVGEGLGMLVLKRLADAERDGDRIYAVIKAVGTSSDGRFKSIYAPRSAGQALALQRAYQEAGFSPATIGLVEAHGTGTMAGDPAEFEAIREVFGQDNPRRQYIALGSVKSQIGHTKAAAGTASLIKVALELHHKVLPPTINIQKPNPKLEIEQTPFYLNTEARPWLRMDPVTPRRAGVSSFGFGGTNFHVVLEEHEEDHQGAYRRQPVAQAVLLSAPTPADLQALCQEKLALLQSEESQQHFVGLVNESTSRKIPFAHARLGFLAESAAEALRLLQISLDLLQEKSGQESWEHPKGIFYRQSGLDLAGKVVALFPGQGSQYLEMGRELALNFPPVRQALAQMDALFLNDGLPALSSLLYPIPVFEPAERQAQEQALQRTENAQPAIGVLSYTLYRLFLEAGLQVNFTAGHSFGELTALWAADVLEDASYFVLIKARGQAMAAPQDPNFDAGAMLAVKGDVERIRQLIQGFSGIKLANWNSHNQVVLAGAKTTIAAVQQHLMENGISGVLLPVSAAFHTPLVGHAHKPFAKVIQKVPFRSPTLPVFSNSTGQAYPQPPEQIRQLLTDHILNPVLFKQEIEAIYAQGGTCFIEFGPKNVLTNLVHNILAEKPHLAIAVNPNPKGDSDRQLREAFIQLRIAGLDLHPIDPYQMPPRVAQPVKKSKVAVTLNGGLYTTEKTRSAFEQALNDGWKISSAAPLPLADQQAPVPSAAGSSSEPAITSNPPVPAASFDLDHTLAQFQAHQSETARIHEQYLQNEAKNMQAFSQLALQEISLLSNGNLSSQQMAQINALFENVERSMARLHDQQSETRRVHEQYLRQQSEFTQSFIRLLGSAAQGVAAPAPRAIEGFYRSAQTGNGYKPDAPVTPKLEPVTAPGQPVELPMQPAVKIGQPQPPAPLPTPALSLEHIRSQFMAIVSEKTGYPAEMLEPGMDMEADLGIDSIKRVEILGALQTAFPDLPKVSPEALAELRTLGQIVEFMTTNQPIADPPVSTPAPVEQATPISAITQPLPLEQPLPASQAETTATLDADAIAKAFLEIVSEKTGYPTEMLETGMDMEADLGIDSIKRVEILGAVQIRFPNLPKIAAEELAELRTLGQVIDRLDRPIGAPPADLPIKSPAEVASSPALPERPAIPRGQVVRKLLPQPDLLQFSLPPGHICLLTDDGTATTAELADELLKQNWKVVALSFPTQLVEGEAALPKAAPRIRLAEMDEEHLRTRLEEIQHHFGPAAVFIHLHPRKTVHHNGGIRFDDGEKAIVKHVFLIAKYLKESLNRAAQKGQAAFLTVARLDGQFGLGQDHIFSPVSGGLFGLVKTLNLEWQAVYCRGVDLSPALTAEQSVRRILDELHDSNHLITEVGYRLCQAEENAEHVPSSSALVERSTLVIHTTPTVAEPKNGSQPNGR